MTSRRAEEQDVALLQFDLVATLCAGGLVLDAAIVVEHRNGEHLLRLLLADHVFVEEGSNVTRDR